MAIVLPRFHDRNVAVPHSACGTEKKKKDAIGIETPDVVPVLNTQPNPCM